MIQNCFTVDVEEWFHICGVEGELAAANWHNLPSRVVGNTHKLLDLLQQSGVRGTFFVLGWVADRYPDLVREIVRAGHEIGSHGYSHRRVYELTPISFAEELDRSLTALAAAGAESVIGFRAPEWSINDRSLWALDVLARKRFRFDSSMTPMRIIGNPAYPTTPHARSTSSGTLWEFPPLVQRAFGQNIPLGGGWGLRMARPERVIRTIARHNQAGTPVALFVHPWEIDANPPRAKVGVSRHFVHYFRLEGFTERLAQVLSAVPFAPMGRVLQITGDA